MIHKYAEIFCWKNVSSFCSAKATHIFSAKNIRILCIESAKTVNEMTLNELVKLTTLWTTRPRSMIFFLILLENRTWHFMQIVSPFLLRRQPAWNVKACILGKWEKYFKSVVSWTVYSACSMWLQSSCTSLLNFCILFFFFFFFFSPQKC